jgi:ribonuclease PH
MGTLSFGEFTIRIDCDVLQADGGTRTAAITGGCVALADACEWLAQRTGQASPFRRLVSAISVGVIDDEVRLDLAYAEDKDAGVDANIVMAEPEDFVEVQGTGEHSTFSRDQLDTLVDLAGRGIRELFRAHKQVLGW